MIIDPHVHLFTPKIIENVFAKFEACYTLNDKAKVLGGNIAALMAIDITAANKTASESGVHKM